MHEIVRTLYEMCKNSTPVNLKSLINTFYYDDDIRIRNTFYYDDNNMANPLEDIYKKIEKYEYYSLSFGSDLYTAFYNPGTTPMFYNYNYIGLDIYDDNYNDWFKLEIQYSKKEYLKVALYDEHELCDIGPQKVNINDDIIIVAFTYNNSIMAEMNLFDTDNAKFIQHDSLLNSIILYMEKNYKSKIKKSNGLLKQYEERS